MAEVTLWISIAVILSTFDISSAIDESGEPIDVKFEYESDFIVRYAHRVGHQVPKTISLICTDSQPKPFACRITPRSAAALELLHNSHD